MLLGGIWRGPRHPFYIQIQIRFSLPVKCISPHKLFSGSRFSNPDLTLKILKVVRFFGPDTIDDIDMISCRNCYYHSTYCCQDGTQRR